MVSAVEKPLIHQVIPLIDQLHTRLVNLSKDETMHMSVRHAANNAIVVLNKYYSRTDECVIYRVAMSKSFFINSNVFVNVVYSHAPVLQNALLQKRALARGVDRGSGFPCSRHLDQLLPRLETSICPECRCTDYRRFTNHQGTCPHLSLPSPSPISYSAITPFVFYKSNPLLSLPSPSLSCSTLFLYLSLSSEIVEIFVLTQSCRHL